MRWELVRLRLCKPFQFRGPCVAAATNACGLQRKSRQRDVSGSTSVSASRGARCGLQSAQIPAQEKNGWLLRLAIPWIEALRFDCERLAKWGLQRDAQF